MAHLINRNTSGRMPCIHGICKYIIAEFGNKSFTIMDLKYDPTKKYNIHDFSPCAVKLNGSSYITCRYLNNPLSRAMCGLVQSVDYDPQKSKSASDIMNALDGLGLVDRDGRFAVLTELGERFAATDIQDPEWQKICKTAVLNYGPFVGMLYYAATVANNRAFSRKQLDILGYPRSQEIITIDGQNVLLSSGSESDTITRTRAVLLSFGISSGLITSDLATDIYEYSMSNDWNANSFKISSDVKLEKILVKKPLSYTNLTKNTRSLRERGQSIVRGATVGHESIIRNRRLAIVYLLNEASKANKKVNYGKLCILIKKYPEVFIIDSPQVDSVMASELTIAFIAGIPYTITEGVVTPLTMVDESVLLRNAPDETIETIQKILTERKSYEI